MKIICCHIENFGKLQNFSMDFTEGTNRICQENGWGKSTFAAFIRAMFYGLEGERKRSIEENERKRYKPWQGGVFGGQLTFEVEGKQYTVSRIFHEKEAQDEFELRDARTNLLSKDFSSQLGEELFHINRESFLRTVFIGQSDCETAATDDINAQIGNLTDNAKDLNSYEEAHAGLTELINSLTPNRITGSLAKRAAEITKLERIVGDGSRIGESLDNYREYLQEEQEYYRQLKEQMDTVCEQQAKVSALQVVQAKKDEWKRLKSTRDGREQELQSVRQQFPGEIPSMEETEVALTAALSLEKLSERVALYSLVPEETAEFAELQEVFQKGLPEQEKATEIVENAKTLKALRRQQAELRLSEEEEQRLEALEVIFTEDSRDVAPVIARWNDCMKRQAALPSDQAALVALQTSKELEQKQKKNGKMLCAAGMVLGTLALLAGVLTVVMSLTVTGIAVTTLPASMVPGIAIAVVGVILLVLGFGGLRRAQAPIKPELLCEIDYLQEKVETDERFIRDTEEDVYAYLTSCGKGSFCSNSPTDISALLQELAGEYYEYNTLKKKSDRRKLYDKTEEIDDLRYKISSYLQQYRIDFSEENLSDNLHELKNKAIRYTTLREKKKQGSAACDEYANKMQSVCVFLKRYGFFPENDFRKQLSDIKDKIDAYRDAKRWFQEASAALTDFEQEMDSSLFTEAIAAEVAGSDGRTDAETLGLKELSALEELLTLEDLPTSKALPTLEELNQSIQKLTGYMEKSHNAIVDYNRRLDDLQEQFEDWEENKLRLDERKTQQAQDKKKFEHLTKARIFLGLAKESITAKYAAPIFDNFCRYYEMITKNSAEKYRIDANTSLTVEERGKQREVNTLSAGYRDLVGICLRVALVDAMYTGEVPMLIMDDPFTNLDDAKTTAAMEFLQEVAKKYQVIYFTCSAGRCGNARILD